MSVVRTDVVRSSFLFRFAFCLFLVAVALVPVFCFVYGLRPCFASCFEVVCDVKLRLNNESSHEFKALRLTMFIQFFKNLHQLEKICLGF